MSGRCLLLTCLGAIAIFASVGCRQSEPEPGPITQGQAEVLLQQAVSDVQANNIAGVCRLSGKERCLLDAEWIDPREVGEPVIVGFRMMDRTEHSQEGAYLETCTSVAGGHVYHEFFVVRTSDGDLVAPFPAYWYPRRFSAPNPDGLSEAIARPGGNPGDSRCVTQP